MLAFFVCVLQIALHTADSALQPQLQFSGILMLVISLILSVGMVKESLTTLQKSRDLHKEVADSAKVRSDALSVM